jgi:hypothetical protein
MFSQVMGGFSANGSIAKEAYQAESALNGAWDNFMSSMMRLQETAYNKAFEAYLSEGAAGAAYIAEQADQKSEGFFAKIIATIKKVLGWIKEKAIQLFNKIKGFFGGQTPPSVEQLEKAQETIKSDAIPWSAVSTEITNVDATLKKMVDAAKDIADDAGHYDTALRDINNTKKDNAHGSAATMSSASMVAFKDAEDAHGKLVHVVGEIEAKDVRFATPADLTNAARLIGTTVGLETKYAQDLREALDTLEKKAGESAGAGALSAYKSGSDKEKDEEDENDNKWAEKKSAVKEKDAYIDTQKAKDKINRTNTKDKASITAALSFVRNASSLITNLLSKLASINAKIQARWQKAKGAVKADETEEENKKRAARGDAPLPESFDIFGGSRSRGYNRNPFASNW